MNIVVDNATRMVLMVGNNLTASQIAAQKSTWCFDYSLGAITVYEGVTLPEGYMALSWTYSTAGVWTISAGQELAVAAAIQRGKTIATLFAGDIVPVSGALSDGVTIVALDVTWDKVATATTYELRYKPAGGSYSVITVADSGNPTTTVRITGLAVSTVYSLNLRAMTQWGMLDWSNEVTQTTAVSHADSLYNEGIPTNLLKFINPDITDDKLAQYLLKNISLAQVTETVNHAVLPGALLEGCIGYLPDIVYSTAQQIVLQAGEIGKQATQIELLNDRISLKLNSNGHVAGMAIGWDESGDVSETVFINDVFKIVLSNGGAPVTAFTEQMVDGVPTLGLNGDLVVTGAITARMLHVDALTALTFKTREDPGVADRSRFVLSATDNYAHFFDTENVERVTIGAGAFLEAGETDLPYLAYFDAVGGTSAVHARGYGAPVARLYSGAGGTGLYVGGTTRIKTAMGEYFPGIAHATFRPGKDVPNWAAEPGSFYTWGGWTTQLGTVPAVLYFNVDGSSTGWKVVQLSA